MSSTEDPAPEAPEPPEELRARGAALWSQTMGRFELTEAERELLRECCRTLDELDALQAVLAADGPVATGSMGQPVAHPALGEMRGARQVLGRLLKQLDLPDDDTGAALPDDVFATRRSETARHAANVRWGRL